MCVSFKTLCGLATNHFFRVSEQGLWRRTGLVWNLDSVNYEEAGGIDTLAPLSSLPPICCSVPRWADSKGAREQRSMLQHPQPQQPPSAEDRTEEQREDLEGQRERPSSVVYNGEVRAR